MAVIILFRPPQPKTKFLSFLPDFLHFSPGPRVAGSFPPFWAQFDKRRFSDLPSPPMGRGKISAMNAHSASPAEKEIPILVSRGAYTYLFHFWVARWKGSKCRGGGPCGRKAHSQVSFAPGCHSSPGLKAWGFLAYLIKKILIIFLFLVWRIKLVKRLFFT